MKKKKLIGFAILINLIFSITLFIYGSLLPYLQLYIYRINLIENKPHRYFSIESSILLYKTSALLHICKDTINRISKDITQPFAFKIIIKHCELGFSDRNDSLTYALLGKINLIAWHKTKENQYLNSAYYYFKLANEASPNNEKAINVQKDIAQSIQYP